MIYYGLISSLWVFALFEGWRRRDARMIFLPLSFVMIWFFIGLRWQTGTDWDPYITQYLTTGDYGFERGYMELVRLCSSAGFSYPAFLLTISFIPLICIFIFLNGKSRYVFVAILFFASNYMLGFMGGNRQSIAVGIIILSNVFIEERKPVHFLVFVCAASLFHNSAAVYLPAYFMTEKRVPFLFKYAVVALLVIAGKDAAPSFLKALRVILDGAGMHESASKVSAYIDQVVFYGFTWSSVVKKVLLLALFDLFHSRMESRDRFTVLYGNLYFFAIVIDTLFGPINVAFMRAGTYYRVAEVVLAAKIFEVIERRELKFIAYVILLGYCVRQLYAGLSFYPDLFIPYTSIVF
jgi:hypothetical protein